MAHVPDDPLGNGPASIRLAVLAAAIDGDAAGAYHFLSDLLGRGVSFEEILFDILTPLELEVGRRWHLGDLSISEEHLITAALETAVSLLAGSFELPADGPRLLVACAEGEAHSLPARLVWAYLVFLGWRAAFLGPGYPAADLGSFLHAQRPAALLLSCTMVTALPGARAAIREAHAAGVPVLAGGAAFGRDDARARALGADAWVAHPTAAPGILENWRPDPAAAEAAARRPGPELALLTARRSVVVGAALEDLTSRPASGQAAASPADIAAHLGALFDALAAALLLDQASVLTGFSAWQRELLSSAGAGDLGSRLAPALAAALGDDLAAAADILVAAVA